MERTQERRSSRGFRSSPVPLERIAERSDNTSCLLNPETVLAGDQSLQAQHHARLADPARHADDQVTEGAAYGSTAIEAAVHDKRLAGPAVHAQRGVLCAERSEERRVGKECRS